MSKISADEFRQILSDGLPGAAAMPYEVVSLTDGGAVLRLTTGTADGRPGGTVSGPVLFGMADLAMYAAVLTVVGNVPLAVTTDATIHFLRKPALGALLARATVLKAGQRLVIGDVVITNEGDDAPVAHAVMSYSVPAR